MAEPATVTTDDTEGADNKPAPKTAAKKTAKKAAAKKSPAEQEAKTPAVIPFRANDWGLAEHKYRSHAITAGPSVTLDMLNDSRCYVHIARNFRAGDELRVIAYDMSFVAYGVVHFVSGNDARVVITNSVKFDPADYNNELENNYHLVHMPDGWAIKDRRTGKMVKSRMASKSQAQRELEDHIRAISR